MFGGNGMANLVRLGDDKAFWFCDQSGSGTGDVARSYTEFKRKVRIVPVTSLEHHMYRSDVSDFEGWFKAVLKRTSASSKVAQIREKRIYGEDLRKSLLNALR